MLGAVNAAVSAYGWPMLMLVVAAEFAVPQGEAPYAQGGLVIAVVAILGKVIYDIVRDARRPAEQTCPGDPRMQSLLSDLREAMGVGRRANAEIWRELHNLGERIARLEGRGERNGTTRP